MKASAQYQKWEYQPSSTERSLVFPDGCRDILVFHSQGKRYRIVQTDLDFAPRTVSHRSSTAITGYRLRPGMAVTDNALAAIHAGEADPEQILASEPHLQPGLEPVIAALSDVSETFTCVIKNSGASARTLQRQFSRQGLPAPEYWRLLGRARRAAQLLSYPHRLAEIAADCSYSDQAHMTREFKRWFGLTPAKLRQDKDVLNEVCQSGLGNWTSEQISIR